MDGIQALIFDLDDTLLMTRRANVLAYEKAFKGLGYEFGAAEYERNFGLRLDAMLVAMGVELTAEELGRLKIDKARHYRELVDHVVPNQPIVDLLLHLTPHYKTALATTASRVNAEFLIDHFKLKPAFDVVVYGEDVKHGKPNPECYLITMERLGVEPAKVLIFEDSETGMAAAKAAGAQYIRVPGPMEND